MKRKIVKIDESRCNGCGLCVSGCHEGALQIVDGKARLVSDAYCDGLGACLPQCPTDAIRIEEREAEAFDEAAVAARQQAGGGHAVPPAAPAAAPAARPRLGGCPGSMARMLGRPQAPATPTAVPTADGSGLRQWPCQIKLVPVNASYFDDCHLLVAADCTAFAHAGIHRYMHGKITLIGCPKLDSVDYAEKLTAILTSHEVRSVTVLRMEVPCCGGLVDAVKRSLAASGKVIPWRIVTISTEGEVLPED